VSSGNERYVRASGNDSNPVAKHMSVSSGIMVTGCNVVPRCIIFSGRSGAASFGLINPFFS